MQAQRRPAVRGRLGVCPAATMYAAPQMTHSLRPNSQPSGRTTSIAEHANITIEELATAPSHELPSYDEIVVYAAPFNDHGRNRVSAVPLSCRHGRIWHWIHNCKTPQTCAFAGKLRDKWRSPSPMYAV
ncbi:hypothetical protein FH972_025753 [Carpinus fangiana]|uniref:Uncharacterized protein n=1 Tax=Carpinus fangiana TaxID=176857 RepID=A0A5N6L2H8_9ROSI|nr:hypothetical protein FH972_025753 [Carpinus fangiana]